MPDRDGYPTEDELKTIREWPPSDDYRLWFDFIKSCWWCPEFGWHEEDGVSGLLEEPVHRYLLSTGGWSGNENIISAMKENFVAWAMTWVQSRRGGHFIFEEKSPSLSLMISPAPEDV